MITQACGPLLASEISDEAYVLLSLVRQTFIERLLYTIHFSRHWDHGSEEKKIKKFSAFVVLYSSGEAENIQEKQSMGAKKLLRRKMRQARASHKFS